MMFQIEYLINESFFKTNEHITNSINPKYIKGSFLIDRRFMQWFTHTHTYIYERLLITHWSCHKTCTKLFLFIYSYYVNNLQIIVKCYFACIMFL
jgi:hypothetical protein